MKIVGILCEYNPMHLGHAKQISRIRELSGPETAVVCLMSGNFVQRGYPAIFDKSLRARAALEAGADLVLELPVQYCLSSAEGFAAGAVSILGTFCHEMSFGAEHPDVEKLTATARALLSPDFPAHLRRHLDAGLSVPAARAKALADMGGPGGVHDHRFKACGHIHLELVDGDELRAVLIAPWEMADQILQGEDIQVFKLLRPGRADAF